MSPAGPDAGAELVAFVDESRKPVRDERTGAVAGSGDHYVVAAAVVMTGDVQSCREEVAAVAAAHNGARPLRWKDLGKQRRRDVVMSLIDLDHWDALLYETKRPVSPRNLTDARVRALILRNALEDLSIVRGVVHATLETRSQPSKGFTTHDRRDNDVLQSLLSRGDVDPDFRISHDGKAESLLWIADAVAGARTDFKCGVDREMYSLMAHRIQAIVSVRIL